MDNSVLISQVDLIYKKANLTVESRYAYSQVELIITFCVNITKVISVKSQCFQLFEGKQTLSIHHDVSNYDVNNLVIVIEIKDQDGNRVGYYKRYVNENLNNPSQLKPLIESSCKLIRLSGGGCVRICIGDVTFRIHARNIDIVDHLKDYITKKEPDCEISISEGEVAVEKRYLKNTFNYTLPDTDVESYIIRKKVAESIINYNGFQIHGAAIAIDNHCYVFTADSGTGKTTHIKLWLKNLKKAYVVNGDHPIIKTEPKLLVYGTPWCGKEGMNTNTGVPLKAIIIMERNTRNEIREISFKEAIIELLRQVYKSSNPSKVKRTLELLSSLDKGVKFYKFRFNNFADDAFSVPYQKICYSGVHQTSQESTKET